MQVVERSPLLIRLHVVPSGRRADRRLSQQIRARVDRVCDRSKRPNRDHSVLVASLLPTGLVLDKMNISRSYPSTVNSISFSFLTTEDVRRISVKQIVNPVLLDDLNRPNIGGLYDPSLGPSDKQDMCVEISLISRGLR